MIVYGINLVYTKSVPLGGYRQEYTIIANGNFFGIPYLFIIAFVIGAIMWFVFNYTRHGKYMYAIGGNEAAAEVAGVNVKKTKIIIYVTATALYAIAGFLLGAKSGGAGVNTGNGYELEGYCSLYHRWCICKRWYRTYLRCYHRCTCIRVLKDLLTVPRHRPELSVYCTGYRYRCCDCAGYP